VRRSTLIIFLALCGALAGAGCRGAGSLSPYAPQSEAMRDSIAAQRLTQRAAALMAAKPAEAEHLLREALVADLYHGPAHNNLGVLHLRRGELYEAASEFEWARKLIPGSPDPRLNLAMTLERAGRITDAMDGYSAALESAPDHIPTMQALARLQIRHGRTGPSTRRYLGEVSLRGDTAQWRSWAAMQLALLGKGP
jgi:Tfp pilus assembly protein PilF